MYPWLTSDRVRVDNAAWVAKEKSMAYALFSNVFFALGCNSLEL